ncbi:NUDIX domain-containing protein [Paenibacillus filicis]|uniref:NUDIX domain-containing protein n=1 Tax=Paenibacillus gyeongsangnamensis TaxID=3388067 RepID=A0ABT4QGL4_9BACL|nr:NUDIX domain-containing protein [Paenibacillus filicis]MCZ8516005.1 NUDIX domain-containing protein [Paenibacillus filicis]
MSNQEEQFDVFDRQMNRIGTASRSDVHRQGLWHQTFHCWVWRNTSVGPVFLVQERHPGKDTFPRLLDISCAGHLLTGEGAEDGVRELEEELGLRVPFSDLVPCGIYAEEDFISERLIDREFCHVFIYRSDQPLTNYVLQEEEVTGLYQLTVEQLRHLAEGGWTDAVLEGVSRRKDGKLESSRRHTIKNDFVPHPGDYYRLLLQTWEMIK